MEDFIIYDPGVAPSEIPGKIQKLNAKNNLLTICVFATVIVAGYYVYRYYQIREEFEPV